ncbi:chaperonin 10-like protein [Lipomyces oligophaga]|uniref:chaperonin 10-like protein n=1 Tax=Lipomyces oligophaga TaxID=45792 RepID=UPI0034CD19FF
MVSDSMQGVVIKGGRKVAIQSYSIPVPGSGQVLLKMHASGLCGSDLRAIYRQDKIKSEGAEGYHGVIAGHEPCGQIISIGPDVGAEWKVDDRVIVYHIHGCGSCRECRAGRYISCHSEEGRKAYGWQRDGGHSDFILASAVDLVRLLEPLSYIDGCLIACGLGTAYAATLRAGISGLDSVVITGLGPVGLGAALLAMKEGADVYGLEVDKSRREAAEALGIRTIDGSIGTETVNKTIVELTGGYGPSVVIDCSGHAAARLQGLEMARDWARVVFVGEGGCVQFDVSPLVIHKSLAIYGSWVCSISQMEDLVEKVVKWKLLPEMVVTDVFLVSEADKAYKLFDMGNTGKVVMASPEELSRWKAGKTC